MSDPAQAALCEKMVFVTAEVLIPAHKEVVGGLRRKWTSMPPLPRLRRHDSVWKPSETAYRTESASLDLSIVGFQNLSAGRFDQHELALVEGIGHIQIEQPLHCPEFSMQRPAVGTLSAAFL